MPESVIWVCPANAPLPLPLARGRLSNVATGAALCGTAAALLHFGGLYELIQGAPALAVIGGATAALIRAGRERLDRRPTTGARPRRAASAIRWQRPVAAAQGD